MKSSANDPTAFRPSNTDALRADADILRRHKLNAFTYSAFHTIDRAAEYSHGWHIDCMCEYLAACYRREITHLIINVPPGYMKSITCSIAFPAWVLGQNPSEQICVASHNDDLSVDLSTKTRNVMRADWYQRIFPATKIARDFDTKHKFMTTSQGWRSTFTTAQPPIGIGGRILIVDDPMNPKKAVSKKERESVNTIWWDQGWTQRQRDKKRGVFIVIMQRIHEKDLTGYLLAKNMRWEHCNLPGIAEAKTFIQIGDFSITREVGDLLHPDREGPEQIAQRKVDLGSYGFAAQYQQRPVPLEGGLVKLQWFKRYRVLPAAKPIRIVQSWDTAQKAEEIHDYSVGQTWHEYADGYYLVDELRVRQEYPDLKRTIQTYAVQHSANVILIEDKSSGQALLQDLKRETRLPLVAMMPQGDKIVRMVRHTATVEAGRCFLPEPNAPADVAPRKGQWLGEFENEVSMFPEGEWKDQIDAFSQFLEYITSPGRTFQPRIVPI